MPNHWSEKVLFRVVQFAYTSPWQVLLWAVILFVLSLGYTATHLTFLADRAALVDQKETFAILADKFKQEFPRNEDLIVVIDGGSTERREAFSDALSERLKGKPKLYSDIFTKVELPFLRKQALLYLDKADLEKLLESLQKAQGMVSALASRQGVGQLLAETTKDLEQMLPVLNQILGQLLRSLQTRGRYAYESPWQKAFFSDKASADDNRADLLREAGRTAFYNTLSDGRVHLLLARPTDEVGGAIANLRAEIKRLKPTYPELDIGITGELVLDEDEMNSSTEDSAKATLWSLLLVIVLFAFSFRTPWRPAMALLALFLAVGWTLGFTTLVVGHLNLLTVTFATMLIGLGIDFGIHFIYGYEEVRNQGQPPLRAMQETMLHAGVENATGAITTAIAFWAICFTDFRGVAELGMIAGGGVMLCFVAMLTVLPALIFLQERRFPPEPKNPQPGWGWLLANLENFLLARPKLVLLACLLFSLWCATYARQVSFDYNLLNLQSPVLQSVQTELKLLSDEHGVLFAVTLADNLEQAESLSEKFSALSSVDRVESVVPLIPKDFAGKAPVMQRIAELMATLPLPNLEDAAQAGTRSGLMKMGDGFLELEQAFRAAYPKLLQSKDPQVRADAREFQMLLDKLFATLEKMGPGPIADGVTTFQTNLYRDLRDMLSFLKDQRAEAPVTLDSLPYPIKLRSIGASGKILLRIYPKENPWEREPLSRFVAQIQKVDPNVIGTPVMVYYNTEALKRAFEISGQTALAAISVILLIHFRNLRLTLLALLPKLVGILWMLGLMGYYEIQFNPANFMGLPLILGIGLIFGVHVVHRLVQHPHDGIFSHSTGPAIALSASTTIAGFGTLMLAHHKGIASLGFVMTVGVAANLVTSLLLLPALMRLLSKP